eukprot:COSAG06_NODE_8854_length_2051_cov_49.363217_2_plen_98_part_00
MRAGTTQVADELEVLHPEEFVPADCVRRTRLKAAIAEHKRTAADVKFEEVVVHEAAMNMPVSSATWAPPSLVRCLAHEECGRDALQWMVTEIANDMT